MQNKPNFIFYLEYWEQLKLLDDKQKGQLLTALFAFQLGEKIPDLDPMTNMAFSFISADVRRNNEKYEEISEKRRAAGRKGGRSEAKKQTQAKQANASNSDSDSDSDSKSVSVSDSEQTAHEREGDQHDTQHTTLTTHTPTSIDFGEVTPGTIPTVDQIRDRLRELNRETNVSAFVEYNRRLNWRKPWPEALDAWLAREPDRKTNRQHFEAERKIDYDQIERELIRAGRERYKA